MEPKAQSHGPRNLEYEHFRQLDSERLAERRLEADRALAASRLAEALGRPNSEWMPRLLSLGLTVDNATAFHLLPLVEVAWADGSVAPEERARLMDGAKGLGLVPGAAAQNLLESWLERRPEPDWSRAWHALTAEYRLHGIAPDERWRLLQDAEAVANAAGGLLGLGAISRAERAAIEQIGASLGAART